MVNKRSVLKSVILSLGLVFLLVLAAIVARPLFLVICVVLVFGYIFKYSSWLRDEETGTEASASESPALKDIRQSIDECAEQLEKLEAEIVSINEEISDMELQLAMSDSLRPEAIVEGRILISRFEEQLALRKTKINFYRTCQQKLSSLEANHLMAKKLEEKQKKLQELQENQYEELASMESLKASLEREVMYLQQIDQLSYRMLNSQNLQEAEALKAELVAVTDELRKL
ncbi:MAG: putative RNase H-like nuclease (RuvC/YqgF family) [Polaribacter sp.]|jgi:predicted RNase H-like nuclease (RuvC/YqgF family)